MCILCKHYSNGMLAVSYPVFRSFKIETLFFFFLSLSGSPSLLTKPLQAFAVLHGETYTQKLGLSSHSMLPVVTEATENSLQTADKGCGFELVSVDTL